MSKPSTPNNRTGYIPPTPEEESRYHRMMAAWMDERGYVNLADGHRIAAADLEVSSELDASVVILEAS